MSTRPAFGRLPTVAVALAVVLCMASCAIELRRDEEQALTASPAAQGRDPLKAQLEQCRTVTAEQPAALEECRRAWSENRSRFLGQNRNQPTAPNPDSGNGQSSASPLTKDQSRLPTGYPSVAPLKKE